LFLGIKLHVKDLKVKYPLKNAKDSLNQLSVRCLIDLVAHEIWGGNLTEAYNVLDREFIYGAWGYILDDEKSPEIAELNKQIKMLIVNAYVAGFEQGKSE